MAFSIVGSILITIGVIRLKFGQIKEGEGISCPAEDYREFSSMQTNPISFLVLTLIFMGILVCPISHPIENQKHAK